MDDHIPPMPKPVVHNVRSSGHIRPAASPSVARAAQQEKRPFQSRCRSRSGVYGQLLNSRVHSALVMAYSRVRHSRVGRTLEFRVRPIQTLQYIPP